MSVRIGFLLPKSTEYPSIGEDIMNGLRYGSAKNDDWEFFTENIGFGENNEINQKRAEKLLTEHKVDVVIGYCSSSNAEYLYPLANRYKKPFIFLDAGMQLPYEPISAYCYHISLQGTDACRLSGNMAGAGNRKVLMATSFYDGGYQGPYSYDKGLAETGGSVCGNYISAYRVAEFTIDPYLGMLRHLQADSVAACFSTYLAQLFFKALQEKNTEATRLPFYCSPFMAEEQLLSQCDFPGGEFHAIVPWSSAIQSKEQEQFQGMIRQETNKAANIFHLLGWEAAIVVAEVLQNGVNALKGFYYDSPRGNVQFHSATHYTYAPLYKGMISAGADGKSLFVPLETIAADAERHLKVMTDQKDLIQSGWKNNYLCI